MFILAVNVFLLPTLIVFFVCCMSAARRVCQIACIGTQTFTERKTAYDQCEGIATVGRALTVLVAEAEQHKQKKIVHNYHLTNKIRRTQTKIIILTPL